MVPAMMPAEFVVSRPCKWGKKTDPWGLTNGRKSVGTDIAPVHPAPIVAVGIGAEMLRGVHLAWASPAGGDQWRGGGGGGPLGPGHPPPGPPGRVVGGGPQRGGGTGGALGGGGGGP